jgi:TetR/AcrR family transcriptional regulator, regulator of autoinduction and epiphytic fitness
MRKPISPRRSYDSTRRQAAAAETRRRILDAAYELFTQSGYGAVTMQAIADEAGVAMQTIYAIFKNKRRVLVELFNVSSAAPDEEHVPMPQRAGPRAMAAERDQRRQLEMFASIVAGNLTGAAPISEIMIDAARTERDIQKILERLNIQRLEHMTLAVEQIAAHGPFCPGVDATSARDIVWTLTSPEVFLLLTRDRGWSKDRYAAWLADILIRSLLT